MRRIRKTFAITLLVLLYALTSLCLLALPTGRLRKRRMLVRTTSRFSRWGLRLLDVHVAYRRYAWKGINRRTRNYLVLSNHLTYLDILVLAARIPSVFITSVELRNTFPLGMLARFGGSIFVERRSPAALKQEIGEIAEALGQGFSVILFPEGTTSNGDTVHPFKNALVSAAIATGTRLLPACIRYTSINGRPLTAANRDAVFYYGGVSFLSHAPRLLAAGRIHAACELLRPLNARRNETRKDLAARAHHAINAAYHAGRSGAATK